MSRDRIAGQLQSDQVTEVEAADILDDSTFEAFVRSVQTYLAATADSAYLLLVEEDDEARCRGVFNCWTLGRHDPRPLVLLRRLLSSLDGRSLLDAISVLAHATAHPDILWSPHNWISPPVEEAVRKAFSWHPDELADIVRKTEALGAVWQRGGHGQSLWMLMSADKKARREASSRYSPSDGGRPRRNRNAPPQLLPGDSPARSR